MTVLACHIKGIVPESARGKNLIPEVEPLPGVGVPEPAHRIAI